ncbi:hypothetical protein O6H91_11G118200 [Diphasiastrum complanatum]|uniref:Uncharacterized protein n=6 Tax=Diphasiastrum complanatum TaxID=34168 RepID=A0ACC2CDE4_DIPCM|nr:hypothetical protein O6H91_11G118200 [Diphasiastrum complanatum]KAJ7540003.1 hypothetical protein O6H91_11G118200 [Diphasiastrum complanatum]KAJ7540004.1 hypothetical protein O6H91_11G118200 [Diphasiastrum complanatum]KAJ7540005.1 hypothetical protein O6H91_11G118200 [Diphasiastrum complanatum]KAJ7540006.1 hypothetical protein O6H91_11G118200 [Diphasiastrum complanatum]
MECKKENPQERMAESEQLAAKEKSIVWPPVVIIENTRLAMDQTTRKYTGLDNDEVRAFLKGVNDVNYSRVMALYDMRGHKGKTLVTFPADDLGYINAQTLSDCLQRIGRGREHWMRVKPQNSYSNVGWNAHGLVTKEGKRILYGYLARPEDMELVDPYRKHVKRWSIESLEEKVHRPAKQRNQDAEATKARRQELEDFAQEATVHLENEKTGVDNLREAINKINQEIQAERDREAAAEAQHRQELALRRKAFDEALQEKKFRYQQFEGEIRARLAEKKASLVSETVKLTQEAQELQNAIEVRKKNHEIRRRKALEEMKHDYELQVMMEARLADLKKKTHERALELQKKHQEQTMKLKECNQKEREDLLQQHLAVRTELESKANVAKEATNRLKAETDSTINKECVVCFFEFGPDNLRAFFAACGHANVCILCAQDLWQRKNKTCPTCKTVQKKKPAEFPVNIYL